MERCSITLKVRTAWWVVPYIQSVELFALMTGMEPDLGKVTRTVLRGITVSL